ncbi:MAG: GEVED domain-containing protein [Crocinitomicaceae bacterium]
MWAQVRRSSTGNPVLTNVTDLRISPTGMFAITTSGQWYTWGPKCYLGDGTAAQTLNYATPMTTAFAGNPLMIALTSDFTNNTFTHANNRTSYFAINPADHKVYALGGNGNGQLGQGNTTISTGWVVVQNSTNTGDLDNIFFISGNDQDGRTTASAGVAAIALNGNLWAWGSNNGMMIGGPVSGSNYTLPIVPGGFVQNVDTANYVELGGHTLALMKKCAPKYCYVGHKTNGSMGDNVAASSNINTFDCLNTPEGLICGVSTYDAADAPLVYENGNPAQHYYICEKNLFLGAIAADADNGQNNNVAWGADNNGTNGDGIDEDGLTVPLSYSTATSTYTTTLTFVNADVPTAYIYAWVDWNNNGKFEASEAFATTAGTDANPQAVNLTWNGITTTCGYKYLRVRIAGYAINDNVSTTNIDERSIGMGLHGEVEDFFVDVDILSDPTGDCDNDGVTNAQEVTDGTNPGDPCSLLLASQTTPPASWNALDCDGDGVTNGAEVTDGTDPFDPCDFNIYSQTLPPSGAWNAADCDGDGVTNGTEVVDGTDPANPCDLIVANQTVMPSAAWNALDCDGDGILNPSDPEPTDPCVPNICVNPAAVDDVATTQENTSVVINVLNNDSAGSNPLDPTSVTVPSSGAGSPSNGTVTVNPDGTVTYT